MVWPDSWDLALGHIVVVGVQGRGGWGWGFISFRLRSDSQVDRVATWQLETSTWLTCEN